MPEIVCLTDSDYDTWIHLLFSDGTGSIWNARESKYIFQYNRDDVPLKYMRELFSDPEWVMDVYPIEVIFCGFWRILHDDIIQKIWSESIDLELSLSCIDSVFDLYRKLFYFDSINGLNYCFADITTFGYSAWMHQGGGKTEMLSGKDRPIFDAWWLVYVKILNIKNRNCQRPSLRAIENLCHENKKEILEEWMSSEYVYNQKMRELASQILSHTD